MACQISLNPLTAWGLLDEAEIAPGDWLLMTAGASTVSNLVAAIARSRGIHTIGIVREDVAEGAARSAATFSEALAADARRGRQGKVLLI
jgi:NADPH:quinone reductase-like Zn-dependent oxidoreductase